MNCLSCEFTAPQNGKLLANSDCAESCPTLVWQEVSLDAGTGVKGYDGQTQHLVGEPLISTVGQRPDQVNQGIGAAAQGVPNSSNKEAGQGRPNASPAASDHQSAI